MEQPGDEQLSCDALTRQIAANRTAESEFRKKDKQVEEGNSAKTAGGVIPGVGLLLAGSIDLSNEEQVKARAFADRNERLIFLSKQKGCTQ